MSWSHPKIRAEHLERRAVVYLRQSTLKQVRENLESQRLQYALADRARELGWTDVEVIDTDLGTSASAGSTRVGFERLVATVALGEVGIILSREVSRLSRTDKDLCHLLEVCQSFNTLIGDEEQVYDLDLMDDQLVLGIKGTMSVVELKVLQMRMYEGRLAKARRGEFFSRIQPGYVLDGSEKIVFDPDERVRESIALVFEKYRQLWSGRQTSQWFREHNVRVPVNQCWGGRVKLDWKFPRPDLICEILKNPFYAGVYFYGRGEVQMTLKNGKLIKKRTRPAARPDNCKVWIFDHHEGYIDWATHEEIRLRMSRNTISQQADPAIAAVRKGRGLLAGLMRCGHCGRKIRVRYWGHQGTAPRYLCPGDYDAGGDYCISFGGKKVDLRLAQEVLEILSPLGIEASLRARDQLQATQSEKLRILRLELEQLDYEVQRAYDQYNQVDPRHRLVAQELERRWNEKLEEQEKLRARIAAVEAENPPLSIEDEKKVQALGENFARVWEHPSCPIELKKKILHTMIEEIVARLEDDKLRLVLHWKGGIHTQLEMRKPSSSGTKTSTEALDVIRQLAPRYGDDLIASVLCSLGHRTGTGRRWTRLRVADARRNYSIAGQARTVPDPEILSLARAAKYCNVGKHVIARMVMKGLLTNEQTLPMAPWEIHRSELDSEPFRSAIELYRRTGEYPKAGGKTDQLKLTV